MRPASAAIRSRRGLVALEAALFLFVALCTADMIRVFRAQLRVEAVAVQIGQIVSQCRTITDSGSLSGSGTASDNSDISQFWRHAERIAGGIVDVRGRMVGSSMTAGGAVIITAVGRNNNANRAYWQRRSGNTTIRSGVATAAPGAATISNGFVVPANQTLFVTEVFAEIQPWVLGAGLIGTVLPTMLSGTTLFLSRAPDPVSLQAVPRVTLDPECTA